MGAAVGGICLLMVFPIFFTMSSHEPSSSAPSAPSRGPSANWLSPSEDGESSGGKAKRKRRSRSYKKRAQYRLGTNKNGRFGKQVQSEPHFIPTTPLPKSRTVPTHTAPQQMNQPLDFLRQESYKGFRENPFLSPKAKPLSTFSIDVDTASYSNIRRFLNHHTRVPKNAIRLEEMINYFTYDYPAPKGKHPFSTHVEIAGAPWNPKHRLVRIGLKGKVFSKKKRPSSNLVFLLDVSGSMYAQNKLPLLIRSFSLLVRQLGEKDRVSIVVYAGSTGLVLPSTSGRNKRKIIYALKRLRAGGSTNGGAGIQLAYQQAVRHFIRGGINRVILATDGDFNVGISSRRRLKAFIKRKAKSGVFLTVLGVGMGNYKDSTLEMLANKGNGNYAYIDNMREAKKVFVQQLSGTLLTIAKDVKIQVEFNPHKVKRYRLIGYENRKLRAEDFKNDKKDAGEIGAGHTVTALYEVIPRKQYKGKGIKLRYQKGSWNPGGKSKELLTLKLRYKKPQGHKSKLLVFPIIDKGKRFSRSSKDFQFAASVASFGMLLRGSRYRGQTTFDSIREIATSSKGRDLHKHRAEFIRLVKKAKKIYRSR